MKRLLLLRHVQSASLAGGRQDDRLRRERSSVAKGPASLALALFALATGIDVGAHCWAAGGGIALRTPATYHKPVSVIDVVDNLLDHADVAFVARVSSVSREFSSLLGGCGVT